MEIKSDADTYERLLRQIMRKRYERLYETYQQLPDKEKASVFTCMAGEGYFDSEIRFMLIGRAANGWGHPDGNTAEGFGKEAGEFFEDHSRWSWIAKAADGRLYAEGSNPVYYISKSKFWTYSEGIYKGLAGNECDRGRIWMENIAWSNLYKISPEHGNPGSRSIKLQWQGACPDILDREIELLQPTHIVFVTDWDWLFDRIKCCLDQVPQGQYVCAEGIYMGARSVVMKRPERAKKEGYIQECLKCFNKSG